jgi:hypothetical protein
VIALAKQRSAAITGVSVIDQPWATAPQAVPIGGSAYKVHRAPSRRDDLGEKTAVDITGVGSAPAPPDWSR